MSTLYAGTDTFPTNVTLPDDGDPADAASISAPMEGLADRTKYLLNQGKRAKAHALGAMPFLPLAATPNFVFDDDDFNYMSVHTVDAPGDTAKWTLRDLWHGGVITSVDVIFIPKSGHAGLPGTSPQVQLVRWRVVSGETPPVVEAIANVTYSPVSLADYNNGKFKTISCPVASHTVDAINYLYQLIIVDEDGANALPNTPGMTGAYYFTVSVTYA